MNNKKHFNKKRIINLFFAALGIAFLLAAYIFKNKKLELCYDISKDVGIVIISLIILDFLWKIVGGEPLREQIEELKNFNMLFSDSNNSGIKRIWSESKEITKEKYEEMISKVKPLFLDDTKDRAIGEKFCDSERCEVTFEP